MICGVMESTTASGIGLPDGSIILKLALLHAVKENRKLINSIIFIFITLTV